MELTRNMVVPRDPLGSRDRTKRVEVTLDLEVFVLLSFAGGGQICHHYFLLLPGSQEEITNLGPLRGRLVDVTNFLHGEGDPEHPPPKNVHHRHDL